MQMHLKTTIQYQAFTYILLLSKDHFTMPLSVNCHINLHTTGKVYHSLDKKDACCIILCWRVLVWCKFYNLPHELLIFSPYGVPSISVQFCELEHHSQITNCATAWMIQGSNPCTDNSCPPKQTKRTVSCSMSTRVISWEVKQSGHELDHSLPSTAEVNWVELYLSSSYIWTGMIFLYLYITVVKLVRSTYNSGMF